MRNSLTRAANGKFVTRETFCQVILPAWVESVNPPEDDGNALETAGVPGIRDLFKWAKLFINI